MPSEQGVSELLVPTGQQPRQGPILPQQEADSKQKVWWWPLKRELASLGSSSLKNPPPPPSKKLGEKALTATSLLHMAGSPTASHMTVSPALSCAL